MPEVKGQFPLSAQALVVPNLSYLSHDDLIADWGPNLTVGILSTAPNPDGTGITEPSTGDGYARQPVTFVTSRASGVTTVQNSIPLVFGPAVNSDWEAVSYFGLFDENNALRVYGRLRTQRTTTVGEATTFPTNDIVIRIR
jgi:hypothetical protein